MNGKAATMTTVAQVAGVVVTVVVGIVLTAVSAGTLTGPYIAAIAAAAGGLTTIGIKYIALGNYYDRREFMGDVVATIVDTVTAGYLPGEALTTFGKNMAAKLGVKRELMRKLLAEVILEAGTGGMSELVKALLDERTYQGTPDEIRNRLLKRIAQAAAQQGGTKTLEVIGTDILENINGRVDGDPATELNVYAKSAVTTSANVVVTGATTGSPLDILLGVVQSAGGAVQGRVSERKSRKSQKRTETGGTDNTSEIPTDSETTPKTQREVF
jgi:hypothetical protein